MTHHGICG